ncbi:MAG: RNB domain-containing ribonuclease [Gammaproteobacteria bacterium]|nr:RNB domain-containing ribonuclease [Gammaproteobacteria bacterium]
MAYYSPIPGSLVLYKIRPALVTSIDEKIEIELQGGKNKRVRPKDIKVLHPGPLSSLSDLTETTADLSEAWELVAGESTDLQELAELIYGVFDPGSAWSTWLLVAEGLYFSGDPHQIEARSAEQVAADLADRKAREQAQQEWNGFLSRLKAGQLETADSERMREVERVALGLADTSRILQSLGIQESPDQAHRVLLRSGYWMQAHNPHPERCQLSLEDPEFLLSSLPKETRVDLTHLAAFAIDDEGSSDPDDAISLDGDRVWVHVADVAAVVPPGGDLDLEAGSRGANLYLPDRTVHMLPPALTGMLGIGLQESSPALSLGFRLDSSARPVDLEIVVSTVRASRHSYLEVERQMDQWPFDTLITMARSYRARRMDAGAVTIDLPEVRVKVEGEGSVDIRPMDRLSSREMVTEFMLMAGEAVARFALENEVPVPFASQPAPADRNRSTGLAGMYAFRRQMKPSRSKILEEAHAGLGLDAYSRVTSPLRRYLDLVTHQQLRAFLDGNPLIPVAGVSERIAIADRMSATVRRAERLSNLHWKLVYLKQNPQWQGKGVVVEKGDRKSTLLIPDLAMETKLRLSGDIPLDTGLSLAVREVDLADQKAWFQVVGTVSPG